MFEATLATVTMKQLFLLCVLFQLVKMGFSLLFAGLAVLVKIITD